MAAGRAAASLLRRCNRRSCRFSLIHAIFAELQIRHDEGTISFASDRISTILGDEMDAHRIELGGLYVFLLLYAVTACVRDESEGPYAVELDALTRGKLLAHDYAQIAQDAKDVASAGSGKF